jgi:hypothetical protein
MRLDIDSWCDVKLHQLWFYDCKVGGWNMSKVQKVQKARVYMLPKVPVLLIVSESAFTLAGSEGRVVGVHRISVSSKEKG